MAASTGTRLATVGLLAVAAGWTTHVSVLRRRHARDPLTQVCTAEAWRQRADRLLRRHPGAVVGLLDLDGFKAINDRHGHAGGDAVLAAIGARLQHGLPAGGIAGRLGGDEFAVAAPRPLASTALHWLHAGLSQPVLLPDGALVVPGVSIGLVRAADLVHARSLPARCGPRTRRCTPPNVGARVR
ncbi:GGDEF domain-containing protein [Saccharopolyspora griseoalba]|uniref:GGDEF domain-containing protein n=1 Tax=Saccharopolyspora griseoalba TaxID=1431848 RepID=A0ABW2LSM9_9PSEU